MGTDYSTVEDGRKGLVDLNGQEEDKVRADFTNILRGPKHSLRRLFVEAIVVVKELTDEKTALQVELASHRLTARRDLCQVAKEKEELRIQVETLQHEKSMTEAEAMKLKDGQLS